MVIRYLHLGPQCPGWANMEEGGWEAARLLGMNFASHDVCLEPGMAREYNLFFPGMIVAADLNIVYPGSGAQIAEIIRRRGPLPGVQKYSQREQSEVDRVDPLTSNNLDHIQGMCIPTHLSSGWTDKDKWLKNSNHDILGIVGFKENRPVAAMEVLPRDQIPYPVPEYKGYFITCLYGDCQLKEDYRISLLTRGLPVLQKAGCTRLGVVAGLELPYPNGPASLFETAGFRRGKDLGRVLLRHRYEDIAFLEINL